jgi:hypothetical protein
MSNIYGQTFVLLSLYTVEECYTYSQLDIFKCSLFYMAVKITIG